MNYVINTKLYHKLIVNGASAELLLSSIPKETKITLFHYTPAGDDVGFVYDACVENLKSHKYRYKIEALKLGKQIKVAYLTLEELLNRQPVKKLNLQPEDYEEAIDKLKVMFVN